MDTLSTMMSVWLLVMLVFFGLGLWLSAVMKRRYPKKEMLGWGIETFPLAFAVAPMSIGFGCGSGFFPAAWLILAFLLSPAEWTPQNVEELMDCLSSLLLMWAALWLLRGLWSRFILPPLKSP